MMVAPILTDSDKFHKIIDIYHFSYIIFYEVRTVELYREIIINLLKNEDIAVEVFLPNMNLSGKEFVETSSYVCLLKIQQILKDDSLNDKECFHKIDEIVRIFERLGSDCGNRHNFG